MLKKKNECLSCIKREDCLMRIVSQLKKYPLMDILVKKNPENHLIFGLLIDYWKMHFLGVCG